MYAKMIYGMKTWLEKVRNKPHHKKTQIIWVCAAIVGAVLLVIWAILGIPTRNNSDQDLFQTFNQDFQDSKDNLPNPITK